MKKISYVFGGLLAALSLGVAAADYPNQSISFVVPYPPGGGTDISARLLTNQISKAHDWNFIVENKPGAAGSVGMSYLARQKPDGYMLGIGQTSNLTINPHLNKDIAYDPIADFTPIAVLASQPMVVVVADKSKYQDFESLLKDAVEGSTRLTMGTPGIGTVSHLSMEYLSQLADAKIRHIPYPGATQAITEVMGGHLTFVSTSLPSALSHIRAGSVRPLVITSKERNKALPNVPTLAELGFDDFDVTDWKAVVGPANMSASEIETLSKTIQEALEAPELIEAFEREGSTVVGGGSEAFRSLLNDEYLRWQEVISKAEVTKK